MTSNNLVYVGSEFMNHPASNLHPDANTANTDNTDNTDNTPLHYEDIVAHRFSRRTALKAGAALGAAAALPNLVARSAAAATPAAIAAPTAVTAVLPGQLQLGTTLAESLVFAPIAAAGVTDDAVRVPAGYVVDIVARWGDPITPSAPAFDIDKQSGIAQAQQVGYNHDFQAFFPTAGSSTAGVLWVNHEYTDPTRMIPGYDRATTDLAKLRGWVDIELEAHGGTVIELTRGSATAAWTLDRAGKRNRRVTANTKMVYSGPAARDARLFGGVSGMLNNCGGGKTPWGTVLTAEENFNQYFANVDKLPTGIVKANYQRMGIPAASSERFWEKAYPERFDVSVAPDEPMKYGWIVEIDPDDPTSTPIKHTALGRFKHEAATVVISATGQLVVYTGDDERFEYFYKYVSYGTFDPKAGKANSKLLTEGTLHAAKFTPDGTAEWIPLVYGSRPELSSPRFESQADICMRTREAGDAVKATKMDRPEDIETNPRTGKVYVVLTNNARRTTAATDEAERAVNPRFSSGDGNRTGHILELTENATQGHAGRSFKWDIFILAGDPGAAGAQRVTNPKAAVGSKELYFGGYTGAVSPIGSPDNVAFSPDGMLWVATDGAPGSIGFNDALHAVPTTGPKRGQVLQFLSVPAGAETCGPEFSEDQKTLFIAVQHPGEDGVLTTARQPRSNPQSTWPDGPGNAPRPTSIAIRKADGGVIGQ